MLKGLGDMAGMMKLQKEFKSMQKKLKKAEAGGETADGSVKVMVNGEYKILGVSIDQELINGGDKKQIEKNVIFAANLAVENIKEKTAQELAKLTGGMNIPGLSDMM